MALSKIDPAGLDIGQIGGRRNLIINGAMQVWQRATSVSARNPNTGGYDTVDRFSYRRVGTWSSVTGVNLTQESDAPDGLQYSLQYETVGNESAPTDTNMALQYILETQDALQASWGTSAAKQMTLSFYVKSSVTGTFSVYISYDAGGSYNRYVTEYSVNAANTWERKTITIAAPTTGGYTSSSTNQLQIHWTVAGHSSSGSFSTSSINQWLGASDKRWSTNQSTGISATSGATWQITGVQLEVGTVATPFEHRSYQDELLACQRYFVQVDSNNRTIYDIIFSAGVKDNNDAWGVWSTPVPLRAVPTYSNSSASHVNVIYGNGSLTTPTGVTISHLTSQGAVVNLEPDNAVLTTGQMVFLGFTNATSGAYVRFDAEL